MGDHKELHVHFSSSSGLGNNNITIQPQRHGNIDVHLGFLQQHYRYQVEFSIPWNLCTERNENDPFAVIPDNQDSRFRITHFSYERDELRLKLEFLAFRENFMKENVQILCCKEGKPLIIRLLARVLGKDMGTPLLRNGIRRIGIEEEIDE